MVGTFGPETFDQIVLTTEPSGSLADAPEIVTEFVGRVIALLLPAEATGGTLETQELATTASVDSDQPEGPLPCTARTRYE